MYFYLIMSDLFSSWTSVPRNFLQISLVRLSLHESADLNCCCLHLCQLWTVMSRHCLIGLTQCILQALEKWRGKHSRSLLVLRSSPWLILEAQSALGSLSVVFLCYLSVPSGFNNVLLYSVTIYRNASLWCYVKKSVMMGMFLWKILYLHYMDVCSLHARIA